MKLPVLVNFWMRWLPVSATYTLPEASTAMPMGPLNCPAPLPVVPHEVSRVPAEVYLNTASPLSTKTFPPIVAIPIGRETVHTAVCEPAGVKLRTALLSRSATHTFPVSSTARPCWFRRPEIVPMNVPLAEYR